MLRLGPKSSGFHCRPSVPEDLAALDGVVGRSNIFRVKHGVGRLRAEHWEMRALHARTVANWIADKEARLLLMEVAERYEQIARIAETKPLVAPMIRGGAAPSAWNPGD